MCTPHRPAGVTSDRGACRFALPVRAPACWAVAFSFPAAAVCQEDGWLVSRGTSRGPMVWISFLTFMSRDARRVPGRRGRAGARATVGTKGRRVRCLVCDHCALGSDPRCSRRKLSIIYGKWTEGLWGIDPAAYESFRKQERRGELPGPAQPVRRSSAGAPGLGGVCGPCPLAWARRAFRARACPCSCPPGGWAHGGVGLRSDCRGSCADCWARGVLGHSTCPPSLAVGCLRFLLETLCPETPSASGPLRRARRLRPSRAASGCPVGWSALRAR